MAEWPHDLLAGLDVPRPMPAGLRDRLEAVLLDAEPGRPLWDEPAFRLEESLLDDDRDVAAALATVDAPRALPPHVQDALSSSLAARQPSSPAARRRRLLRIGALAAGLMLLAGLGIVLAARHSSPTTEASRPVPHRTANRTGSGTSSNASGRPATGTPGTFRGPLAASPNTSLAPYGSPVSAGASTEPNITNITPHVGPAGTTVTLTGQAFTGATAVRFGTADAHFTILSDTELRVTAPPGSGTVNVLVMTRAGSSAPESADSYRYTD
jgi:IPT/TIG domain